MIIAIDFDNTFTADPEAWREVILMMQARGHRFVCVTGRSNEGEWAEQVNKALDGLIPVVFAGHQWKREAAKKAGFDVSIWIDDMPEYIGQQNILLSSVKKN